MYLSPHTAPPVSDGGVCTARPPQRGPQTQSHRETTEKSRPVPKHSMNA